MGGLSHIVIPTLYCSDGSYGFPMDGYGFAKDTWAQVKWQRSLAYYSCFGDCGNMWAESGAVSSTLELQYVHICPICSTGSYVPYVPWPSYGQGLRKVSRI